MKMKLFMPLAIVFVLTSCATKTTSWKEILDYGGIEIIDLKLDQKGLYLDILCDATGMNKIANEPNLVTSYPLYYTKSKVWIKDSKIGISLIKEIKKNGKNIDRIYLPEKIKNGTYQVVYDDNEDEHFLKEIVVIQ